MANELTAPKPRELVEYVVKPRELLEYEEPEERASAQLAPATNMNDIALEVNIVIFTIHKQPIYRDRIE